SGDLIVDVNADSSGSLGNYRLWNREGGSADNPARTTNNISTYNGLSVNRTWYLYARDCAAGDTGYIDSWTITVRYDAITAPSAPTLNSPGTSSSPGPQIGTLTPTMSWNSVSGATGYGLYIRDVTTDTIVYDNESIGSVTSIVLPSGTLQAGHDFRWNMRAKNSAGFSGFSSLLYFKTQPAVTIPNAPTLNSPGSSSSPGPQISTLTPTMSWNSVSGATGYGLYIRDVTTDTIVYDNTSVGNVTSLVLPSGTLQPGHDFRWNMQASNSAGFSSYSSLLYFNTQPVVTIPNAPTLNSPGASSSPGPQISTLTPTMSWNSVSGATGYGLYIRDVTTDTIVYDNTSVGNVTSLVLPAGTLQAGHDFRWNMQASNSAGFSAYSSLLYFQTQSSTAPSAPVQISPGTATSPGQQISTLTPTMSWSAASGATGYGVYIRDLVSNTIVYDNDSIGNVTSIVLPSGILQSDRNYRWNMRAHNSAGSSGYTSPLHFHTHTGTSSNGFDYPIGSQTYYTQAHDGDGWYNAQDFGDYISSSGKYHLGEDWNGEGGGNTDLGEPVYSIGDGTIVFAGNGGTGWGNMIIVRHTLADSSQVESLYAHLQTIIRSSGTVTRREQIGTVGTANGLYYAHLHLEIRTPQSTSWGSPGPGNSTTYQPTGWLDPSDFIDGHRPVITGGDDIFGIDVSQFQNTINWPAAHGAGKDFAFVRATQGKLDGDPTDVDDNFYTNIQNAHAAGFMVGAYHVAYPNLNPGIAGAQAEAENFVTTAGAYMTDGYLRPVLDLERGDTLSAATLTTWVNDWMAHVELLTGVEPIIYVNTNYATYELQSSVAQYDLWIADYGTTEIDHYDPSRSPRTGVWNGDWDFWQYSQHGSTSGISGEVDLNIFNGDLSRLQSEFVIGDSTPVAPYVVELEFEFEDWQAIAVTFNLDVGSSVTASDFAIRNIETNQLLPNVQLWDYYAPNHVATLRAPVIPDGRYSVTINAGAVTSSGVPSTQTQSFEFFVLTGDLDRDGERICDGRLQRRCIPHARQRRS
ncbi:MAG TPA: GH25 family lysozyme, partial [Tepidisphaeraceae bacterium]|nr:GH25 family lysozyme [Tepidisphaeraceae bacterium]